MTNKESTEQSLEKNINLKKKFECEFGNQKNIDKASFLKIYAEIELNSVFCENQRKILKKLLFFK